MIIKSLLKTDDVNFFLKTRAYLKWRQNLELNRTEVVSITIHSIIKSTLKLYSAFLEVRLKYANGIVEDRGVLVRQPSVVIVPYFFDETGPSVILVSQKRVCHGGSTAEFPAGMIEGDESLTNAALRELSEEIGHPCAFDNLSQLTEDFFVCESIFSESVTWFSYELDRSEALSIVESFNANVEISGLLKMRLNETWKTPSLQVCAGALLLANHLKLCP